MSTWTGPRDISKIPDRDSVKIVTPDGHAIDELDGESKLSRQFQWIKKLGFGTIFFFVTGICSALLLVVNLATPAVKQGEINGSTNTRLDGIAATQKESDERHTKALLDGMTEIKDLIKKQSEDMRQSQQHFDQQLIEVRQDTKGLWNWIGTLKIDIGELKGRVTVVEAVRPKDK